MPGILQQPLPIVVVMLILLLASRMLGELMERYKQPAVIGEVLAGIILGPSLLGFIYVSGDLKVISDLGVFLLVILAGFEINQDEMRNSIRGKSKWIGVMGFIIPMISGIGLGYLFNLDWQLSLFLGLCISITALPVSIRILMDLGKLNTDLGQKIITAAVFNDIISLLILGIILDYNTNTDQSISSILFSIGITIFKVIAFIGLVVLAYKLLKKASIKAPVINQRIDDFLRFLKGKESLFALVMLFVLIFAALSEIVGLHFVVGAFFAAVLLPRDMIGQENFRQVQRTTSGITIGFLSPVFFATIGLEFNFLSIENYPLLIGVLLVSFISKILGGYFGGRVSGMNPLKSMTLGFGLNARGIMELVIANIALKNKIIDISIFSILVLMGMLTTFVTPFFLKYGFDRIDQQKLKQLPKTHSSQSP